MQKLAILIAGFMFFAGCASNDTASVDTMDDAAVGSSASSSTSTHRLPQIPPFLGQSVAQAQHRILTIRRLAPARRRDPLRQVEA